MKLTKLAKIVANISTLAFGVMAVGGKIAMDNSGAITAFLGQTTQEKVDSGDEVENIYYFSNYSSIADLQDDAKDATSRITQEGAVLLKNDNHALPLKAGAKINLYSSSSVNYIYSGGGSSFAKRSEFVSLKEGLEKNGFQVNQGLWDWYSTNKQYNGDHTTNTSSDAAKYTINDAKWSQIGNNKNDPAEAGIFVLSRYGTEATDLKNTGGNTSDYSHGNYLELSPSEIDVLKNLKTLKDKGTIQKIIVLLNSVNQVQCDYVDLEEYGIDSLLWVGIGGSNCTDGIAKILNGKANPSGKLTDTYWKKHAYNPVYANFGSYTNEGDPISTANGGKSNRYVVYQEGIYNGYRYTETRYEDKVLKTDNVGDFSYKDIVAYPFGYGLSYTTFSYSDFQVKENTKEDTYELSVKVTNTGNVSGKEGVDFFLQKPYTKYDKDNHVEKASIELVDYAKTSLLKPGASETVTVTVEGRELASYDSYKAKTYILDEGDYYFATGKNAHEALNNVLAAKGYDTSKGMDENGNAQLTYKFNKQFSDTIYSHSKATGEAITNQFDNADLNLYEHRGDNSVNYITRSNWNGTVKFGLNENNAKLPNNVRVKTNSEMIQDGKKKSETIQPDDIPNPTYGEDNGLTLASMMSMDEKGNLFYKEYDDPEWDKLLNELTFEDTVMLLSNGLRKTAGIETISKPQTIDGNGALGPVGGTSYSYEDNATVATNRFTFLYDDPDSDASPISYPTPSLLAATRNNDLAEELGEYVGEDCLWAGYSGLYGLGINIHRGSYNGRAFEYASEDGTLAGKVAAKEVQGIHKMGVYVYMKHAILNDQEKNREGVNTWANEQTIRENYLKPFQIAIEEADAENVMTGFNRIGVTWTSQQGFINSVLRKEFGMSGFAVSDYWQGGYMDMVGGILGGCALPDGDNAVSADKSALYKYKEDYGALTNAMREEAHRILYTVLRSNAMNGIDVSTIFRTVTPPWMKALNGASIAVDTVFGLSVAFFAFALAYDEIPAFRKLFQKKKKE